MLLFWLCSKCRTASHSVTALLAIMLLLVTAPPCCTSLSAQLSLAGWQRERALLLATMLLRSARPLRGANADAGG